MDVDQLRCLVNGEIMWGAVITSTIGGTRIAREDQENAINALLELLKRVRVFNRLDCVLSVRSGIADTLTEPEAREALGRQALASSSSVSWTGSLFQR